MAKNHGLNPRVNYVISRDYFINQTEKVLGDKFEIVY
jgi:hypothetical protein